MSFLSRKKEIYSAAFWVSFSERNRNPNPNPTHPAGQAEFYANRIYPVSNEQAYTSWSE